MTCLFAHRTTIFKVTSRHRNDFFGCGTLPDGVA
jgi:hypothetical protein